MPSKKKAPATRKKANKKGAPRGNQNARTHGLYSNKIDAVSADQALTIEQRRNIADAATRWVWDSRHMVTDVADLSKLMQALRNAMDSANNCERTLAIVQGKYTPIDDVIRELKNLDPEED